MKTKAVIVAIALLASAGAAAAQSPPKMKAGLWESTTKSDQPNPAGRGTGPTLMCIDDSVWEQMMKFSQGMMQGMCQKNESAVNGNKVTANMECNLGVTTMRSSSVTTFTNDTSYHTESKATFDPPMFGNKGTSSTVDAKHIGACKPGMKPGDVTTGGQTVNILDLSRAAAGQRK